MPLFLRDELGSPTAVENLPPTTAEVFALEFSGTLADNPLTRAMGVYDTQVMENHAASPQMTREEVSALAAEKGTNLQEIPETGYKRKTAEYLIERQRAKAERRALLSSARDNFITNAARFSGGLAGSFLDPINIASGFVPVVSQAKYLSLLKGASSGAGRFAIRAGVGAVEGAAGAALVEPLNYATARQLHDDYTLADSAVNLMFGTAMGSTMHSVGGFIGDRLKFSDYAKSKRIDATPHPVDKLTELPQGAKNELTSVAADHVLNDNPVEVSSLVDFEITKESIAKTRRVEIARELDPEAFDSVVRISNEIRALEAEVLNIEKEGLSAKLRAEESVSAKERLEIVQNALKSNEEGIAEFNADTWHRIAQEEADILASFDFRAIENAADQAGIDHTVFVNKLEGKKAELAEANRRVSVAYQQAQVGLKTGKRLEYFSKKDARGETPELESAMNKASAEIETTSSREPNQLFVDENLSAEHAKELEELTALQGEDPAGVVTAETAELKAELQAELERTGNAGAFESIVEEASANKAKFKDLETAYEVMSNCMGRKT